MTPVEFDRRKQQTRDLDESLTPLEIAALIETQKGDLPFAIRPLLEGGQRPSGYVRESWSKYVNYYTANANAPKLIVAFCGSSQRPGVQASLFLQTLRDDLFDVIVLRDPHIAHFNRGIPGVGDSLREIAARVGTFADTKGYQEIITYGASMGGYAALRAGLLMQAGRAISIGGRYYSYLKQHRLGNDEPPAFDPLCLCYSNTAVKMLALVAAKHAEDMRHLKIMLRSFPTCRAILVDSISHGVQGIFYRLGLGRLFHACLFEGEFSAASEDFPRLLNDMSHLIEAREGIRSQHLARLQHVARNAQQKADLLSRQSAHRLESLTSTQHQIAGLRQELASAKRELQTIKLELGAIYASRSWKITRAMRLVGGLLPRRKGGDQSEEVT